MPASRQIPESLDGLLDEIGMARGELDLQPIGDGHSNLTFLVERDEGVGTDQHAASSRKKVSVVRQAPAADTAPTHDLLAVPVCTGTINATVYSRDTVLVPDSPRAMCDPKQVSPPLHQSRNPLVPAYYWSGALVIGLTAMALVRESAPIKNQPSP